MRSTGFHAPTAVLTGVVLAGLAGAAASVAAAPAGDRAYTIANYPVEARAKNAVAAKETAIADGQKAAFRSLLKRIVPVTAYRSLERLGEVDAASLIDGVAVRSERNSATRYIASLDFSFQAAQVRDLLTRQGIPYVDTQAPQTLLVPLVRDAKSSGEVGPASGTWASVWPSLDLTNTVTPVRIEALKPEIGADVLQGLEGDPTASVTALAAAYGTDQVLVAIAEVDTAGQRVHVLLAGQDAVGPFSLKRSYRLNDGDVAYTLELAAVVSQGILEGRWKAVNERGVPGAAAYGPGGFGDGGYGGAAYGGAGGFGGGQDVAFEAEFAEKGEWDEMRRVLLEAPGIDDIRIGSVSAGRATISVKYPGGGPALAQALAGYGISLQNAGGVLVMRSQRR